MIARNVSFSQIKSWQECRRQWAYKYRDGFRPKQPKLEFMRGSLLHLGMESGVNNRCGGGGILLPWWERAVYHWKEEWAAVGGKDELIVEPGFFEGCREIVEGALDILLTDWRPLRDDKGPMLERRLYAELGNDTYRGIVFIPDLVAERLTGPFTGGVFGLDFKSFGKPKLPIAGDVDLQSAIYQHGLCGKGHNAIGSCLFQLATEPRKAIRIRKDGQPYAGDQERYDNWKPVTGQIITTRSADLLEGIWSQVVLPITKEMHDAELAGQEAALVPHLDYYGCQYCEFFAPCQARLKGHDEDAILADSFNRREKRQKGA